MEKYAPLAITAAVFIAVAFAGFGMNGMLVSDNGAEKVTHEAPVALPETQPFQKLQQEQPPENQEPPAPSENVPDGKGSGAGSFGGGFSGSSSGSSGAAGQPPQQNDPKDTTPPFLAVRQTSNPVLEQQAEQPEQFAMASAGPQAYTTLLANYTLEGETENGVMLTINGENVPAVNGQFYHEMNLTEGENNITITSTDASGNNVTWNTTRLIDRDMLPDWYEEEIGTDPLNSDTNNDTMSDDSDDMDADGIPNYGEFTMGLSPKSNDTDNDSLTDTFELYVSGTGANLSDSDSDGVPDGEEDQDYDNRTNEEEQAAGTDPFSEDTDNDGLSDYNETVLGTDPISSDTDSDGVPDQKEIELNTNPQSADSDFDGVNDGNETYTQHFGNDTVGASMDIASVGGVDEAGVTNETSPYTFLENLSGLSSGFTDFSSPDSFSSAIVRMDYDPETTGDPSTLKIYYFDPETGLPVEEPVQGVNTTGHYIWANTTHFSYRFLADPSGWQTAEWNRAEQVYSSGETMRVKVRVKNLKPKEASNAVVSFYAGDPSQGQLIGSQTVTVSGNGVAWASIDWIINPFVTKICVKADPSNLITETDESNNNACRDISDMVDTDGDGLSDVEETSGMRLRFPYNSVYTDPNDPDTDGDGLSDGEEMGAPTMYQSQLVYIPVSDPSKADTDNDGLDDWEELEGWEAAAVKTKAAVIQINEMLADGRDFSEFIQKWDVSSDPFLPDTDRDGLPDYEEYLTGSSPRNADTDTDRIPDGIDGDPTQFDIKAPEIKVISVKPQREALPLICNRNPNLELCKSFRPAFEIKITCLVTDESGIKRVYSVKNGATTEREPRHGAFDFSYSTILDPLAGSELVLYAEDTNGNEAHLEVYRENSTVMSVAWSITLFVNVAAVSPYSNDYVIVNAGAVSGFSWSVAQDIKDISLVVSNPSQIADGIAAINKALGPDVVEILKKAFLDEAAELQSKSNPFREGDRRRLIYSTAWGGGYAAGKIATLIVSDKGISKAVKAANSLAVVQSVSRLKAVHLVKAAASMDLKYKLAIGAGVVSSTYGLQELFPDINVFRTMNDMSVGYAKMMIIIGSVKGITNRYIRVLPQMGRENINAFRTIVKRGSTESSSGVDDFISKLDEASTLKLSELHPDSAAGVYRALYSDNLYSSKVEDVAVFIQKAHDVRNIPGFNRISEVSPGNMAGAISQIKEGQRRVVLGHEIEFEKPIKPGVSESPVDIYDYTTGNSIEVKRAVVEVTSDNWISKKLSDAGAQCKRINDAGLGDKNIIFIDFSRGTTLTVEKIKTVVNKWLVDSSNSVFVKSVIIRIPQFDDIIITKY